LRNESSLLEKLELAIELQHIATADECIKIIDDPDILTPPEFDENGNPLGPTVDRKLRRAVARVQHRQWKLESVSRDMGASWCTIAYAVWLFLFRPGSSVGFGSRKAQLVDRIGDMDSLFEKIRHCVAVLPPIFKPRYDASYMKLRNRDSGATITGESGDEIGRGGRKLIYFVDEAAHLEHPELIEAALSEKRVSGLTSARLTALAMCFIVVAKRVAT
jgi:hypothetical protein